MTTPAIPRAILGRPFTSAGLSATIAEWIEREWSFPEHQPTPVAYAIRLDELDHPPRDLHGGEATIVALHRVTIVAHARGRQWTFGDAAGGARLTLDDRGSGIETWGATPATFAALFLSLGESLRASGLLPLHASVVARDGAATALAAPSGVGKSTTLWRAATNGWSPLAEDFAWLDPETLDLFGWDRGVRLRSDARERFAPNVPADRFRRDADGKLFLSYDELPSAVRSAKLDRVVRLERDDDDRGDGGQPTPLSPRDAVRTWWEMVGVPLDAAARARVAADVARLTKRVPAFSLRLGALPPVL